MKIKRLSTIIFLSLLLVGLFGGCSKKEEITPATIFYSKWISVNHPKESVIPAPEITQDVLEKGMVLVYMGSTQDPTISVELLPRSIQLGAISEIHYRLYVGKIGLFTNNTFTLRYRYIVMTGGMPGARKAAIDYSDYEAVKKAYNIPD